MKESCIMEIDQNALIKACSDEKISVENTISEINKGHLVLVESLASLKYHNFQPMLVGDLARGKTAALIGMSSHDNDVSQFIDGLNIVLSAKPDIIMDLSTNPMSNHLRSIMKQTTNIPIGCGLTYDLFKPNTKRLSRAQILESIEMGLSTGVDIALLHVGVTHELLDLAQHSHRIMPITSRGGGLIAAYMNRYNVQNPLLDYFDDILLLFRKYGVVFDFGDVFRPGCIADADDTLKIDEVVLQAKLRQRVMKAGVQVICESGGHIPFSLIPKIISTHKLILEGSPLWLTGPLPLDTAICHDSIANAIGVVAAAHYGGNMFCSITDCEHYAMPSPNDTASAIWAVKVAIATANISIGNTIAIHQNNELSSARRTNQWEKQICFALDSEQVKTKFSTYQLLSGNDACSICGEYCPHKLIAINKKGGNE